MDVNDKRDKPLSQIAREAIAVQDASNLRGVLLSWHKAICQDCVARGGQAEEFINLLYLGKVCSLMKADGTAIGDARRYTTAQVYNRFTDAYDWAKRVSGEG